MKTVLLTALCLAANVLASPISESIAAVLASAASDGLETANNVSYADITTEEMRNFRLYAQYAGSAYCEPVAGRPIHCQGDICPTGGKANNATVYSVFHGIETDVLGYIAVDSTTQHIVVSIRGPTSIANWLANIVWTLAKTDLCRGCEAHMGFLLAYGEIVDAVDASLASATAMFPDYKIIVTGHSLGAAIATLVAVHIRDDGRRRGVDLYTFGSPRVGNEALARHASRQLKGGQNYRVTHVADSVTRLPPINRDYRHTSPEYWLAEGPSTRVAYEAGDVMLCRGYANVQCSAGAPWYIVDLTSHLYYFVAITQCAKDSQRLSFGGLDRYGSSSGLDSQPISVNGTTVTNASSSSGLALDTSAADNLAMYAKLDQEYVAALANSAMGAMAADFVF